MPQKPPQHILRDKHEGKLSLPTIHLVDLACARPSRRIKARRRQLASRRAQARRVRGKRKPRKAA